MAARLTERIRSLGYIANLVNAGSALDEVLELIVTAVCQRSTWSSSAIMAADEAAGESLLVARYDPLFGRRSVDRWSLDTSPIRTVLRDRRAIVIEDAQACAEFPGYQREAIERDYHSVVVLPFSTVDEMGRGLVLSVHAHQKRKVDEAEIAFLETVALLGSLAVEKAHRLRLDAQQNARLQAALDIHRLAMEQVLSTEDLGRFVELFGRHLPYSFLLVDLTTNLVIAGGPSTQLHEWDMREVFLRLAPMVRTIEMGGFQTTRDIRLDPLRPDQPCTVIIEPCIAAGAVLGGVVLLSEGRSLEAAEALTAQELRAAFSVLLLRQRIRFEARADTHGEFFARLFTSDWRDAPAMLARARHLGLPLDAPARLAAIRLPAEARGNGSGADIEHALSQVLQQRLPGGTAFQDGDLLILFLPERKQGAAASRKFLGQLLQEVEWLTRSAPTACLGPVCRQLDDYREARRDAGVMLDLAEKAGRTGIVEGGDFGPLARLIALSDTTGLRRFVDDTIGRIVLHDAAHHGQLTETLSRFLSLSCRHQATADALGIHVSTCRYRLQRLRDLFGLDLDDPDTRLGLELALRIHREREPR